MRTLATRARAINQYNGLGNQLWDLAGNRPSLDLRFADEKSLVDATTGANLIDFSRASSGTYVGSDGLIKTATTNYLLQSEDFSTTWSPDGVCTVDPDQILSPIGTSTADKITVDAGGPNRVSQTPTFQVSAGGTYIISAYVKTLDINIIGIRIFLSGSDAYADYHFANNSFSVTNSTVLTQTGYTLLSDGWTRIFVKYEPTVSGSVNIRIGGGFGGTSESGSFYIWGAQLEQSSTVGEYIPTTSTINSAPRFNHDPTTGESLGLLVEESRTNLLQRSEEFDNAYWGKVGLLAFGSGSTANAVTAPDGNVTADLITPTTPIGNHGVFIAWPGSSTRTVSIFVKPAGYSAISFSSSSSIIIFDLTTETIIGTPVDFSQGTITKFQNGWYRVSAVITSPAGGNLNILVYDNGISFAGDGTSGIYIWGAQLEEGSFPTSYIKNVDNSLGVTRAADVASISGANFFSWYNASEGTLFADSERQYAVPSGEFNQIFFISDGTGTNTINLGYLTANASQFRIRTAGSNEANLFVSTSALRRVTAGAYAANDAATSEAGSSVSVGSPGVLPSALSQLNIGTDPSAAFLNGTIRRLAYWKTRLPNETLQTITN